VRRTALTALAASLATAGALAGCSSDYAPVGQAGVTRCLRASAQTAGPFQAARKVPLLKRLRGADGASGSVAVRRRELREREGWAYLVFFDGAKKAEAAEKDLQGGGLKWTRRQNAIAVFGRSSIFGRAPTGAQKRLLQRCFTDATRK
jgi:hypothetical protein